MQAFGLPLEVERVLVQDTLALVASVEAFEEAFAASACHTGHIEAEAEPAVDKDAVALAAADIAAEEEASFVAETGHMDQNKAVAAVEVEVVAIEAA